MDDRNKVEVWEGGPRRSDLPESAASSFACLVWCRNCKEREGPVPTGRSVPSHAGLGLQGQKSESSHTGLQAGCSRPPAGLRQQFLALYRIDDIV